MKLSVIVPCYNEEKTIEKSTEMIVNHLSAMAIDYELLLVNDGSKDNTLNLINSLSEAFPTVVPVNCEKNGGKGSAVNAGIREAKGDYLLFMDADLSTHLSAVTTFMEEISDNDMVIGSRRHPDSVIPKPQGPLRQFIGNCCVVITKIITGTEFNDTQCGFKGFTRELGKVLVEKQRIFGWAFDVEYLYIAKLHNKKVKAIPVKWENDEESKVSPLKSSVSFFIELIKIVKNKKYYK
mgnify:CR=1 FL=1